MERTGQQSVAILSLLCNGLTGPSNLGEYSLNHAHIQYSHHSCQCKQGEEGRETQALFHSIGHIDNHCFTKAKPNVSMQERSLKPEDICYGPACASPQQSVPRALNTDTGKKPPVWLKCSTCTGYIHSAFVQTCFCSNQHIRRVIENSAWSYLLSTQ